MGNDLFKAPSNAQIWAIFAFGVVYITIMLVLAFVFQAPTPLQYLIVRVILALAAAAIATLLTGFINLEIPNILKAGGAFAVFIVVFFYNPASARWLGWGEHVKETADIEVDEESPFPHVHTTNPP
jgi:uncharacterized BrkB/YihY/UPF0761 family membrane protein